MTAVVGVALATSATAQVADSEHHYRVEDLRLDNGWTLSENGVWLDALQDERISQVEVAGDVEQGELKDYNGAERSLAFTVDACSYMRLTKRLALYGQIGYRNFTGYNMSGSYFIDPSQMPFDIVEYTQENGGKKHLEHYNVAGMAAYRIADWVAIGAGVDYSAANYAKRKDLRHINSMMDMSVTAGVKFTIGQRLQIGGNYIYRRRNESLQLSVYGTTDRKYSSLLSYGALFGKIEILSDSGYTKEDENKPLFDTYHGGSLQLLWQISPAVAWFNQVDYRVRKGYYGEPSPYTVVYANHSGNNLSYDGAITIAGSRADHTVELSYLRTKVANNENLYRYYNESGGLSFVEYLGQTQTGTRTEQRADVRYTSRIDTDRDTPKWSVRAAAQFCNRNTYAVNYPDYRRQAISYWRADVAAERNIRYTRNIFTLGLGLGSGAGFGEPFKDGSYTSGSSQTLTRTLDDMLRHEYEYLTAYRLGVGVDVGYARYLGQKNILCYARAEILWQKAFESIYMGRAQRIRAQLTLGCYF